MTSNITAEYKRVLDLRGETMTLKRVGQSNLSLKGFMRAYAANELVGEIAQGDRQIIIGVSELDAVSWPVPIKKGDQIVARGKTFTIQTAEGVAVGESVVRHNLSVRG